MIPAAFIPLASHLWQSTLFAVVLGLLTLALRPNRARVRYGLWLAASYKFLLPFSWLVSIGNHFHWRVAPAIVPSTFTAVAEVASPPIFLSELPAAKPVLHPLPWLLYAIWALWACGFIAVATSWVREWLRMRAIVRSASPLPLGLPIRAVSTSSRLEPGVFGLFRPVLLLPEGIAYRLTPSQMQTILDHELCHVRRRDNLAAAIHMIVEAIFWFHPLVWWIGARLVKERERACDEAVIAAGGNREAYAEALLTVCLFYVKLPLASAAGVAGADLRKRIERIMTSRVAQKLNGAKKALLAATAAATVLVPIFIGSTIAPASRAAAQADSPTSGMFQVVHIQVAQSGAIGTHILVGRDSLQLQNYPLRRVIGYAYGVETGLVTGPDSLLDAKYNLEAKAPGPLGNGYPAVDEARAMLRNLLAEKFQIEVHRGTQSISAYVLTSAGANVLLKVAQAGEPGPRMQQGQTSISGIALRMSDFVELLSRRVDHPVIDQTGLTQTYDFKVDWTADVSPAKEPDDKFPGPLTNPKPEVITAAMLSQLGLKMQLQQIPAELLIVDRVQLPSDIAAAHQAVAMDPALFNAYAGHYALPGNLIMTVFRDGGDFQAQLPDQPPLEIFPEGQGKFFANAVDVQIDFGDGSQGRSSGLVLHQNGRDLNGPRMDDATAERMLEAQKTKFQQQVSTTGTEPALRKMILGLAAGKPNFSEMNPRLAEAVTEQLPEMQRRFAKLGSLVSIKFSGVDPMGRDIYDAQFEHGTNEWHLLLSADGKIDTAFVGPDR